MLYIRSYPSYLEAFTTIRNVRTRHAAVAWDTLNVELTYDIYLKQYSTVFEKIALYTCSWKWLVYFIHSQIDPLRDPSRVWCGLEPVISEQPHSCSVLRERCALHIIILATLNVNELLLLVGGCCTAVHSSPSTQEVSATYISYVHFSGKWSININTIFKHKSLFFMKKMLKLSDMRFILKFHTVANFPTVGDAKGYKYSPHGNYFQWLQRTMGA
jgi:hypothetical protein